MEITLFGYIFIPFFIYFFFKSIDKLFLSLVFFSPFTATSVINVNSITFGLQVYVFITILLFIYLILFSFSSKSINVEFNRSEKFIFYSVFFLFLSLIISFSLRGFHGSVTFFNFTQFVYLSFGFLTCFCVYFYLKINPHLVKDAIKVYIYSGFFCALWAFYQLVTILLGLEYSVFFNNSISDAALKFDMTLETGASRIASVAVEPSVLARTLASVLIMLITMVFLNPNSRRTLFEGTIIISVIIALLLTASSSAVISFVAIGFILFFFRPIFLLLICFSLVFFINYFMITDQVFYDSLVSLTVDKIYTYSYYQRMTTIEGAWIAFLDAPFFGDGWESHPAQDVFAKLLGNTGIIGTILFIFIFIYPLYRSIKSSFYLNDSRRWMARSVAFSLIVVLFVDIFTSLSFVFGFMWVLLGMLFFISGDGLKEMELDLCE